jgi:hypothetical protein
MLGHVPIRRSPAPRILAKFTKVTSRCFCDFPIDSVESPKRSKSKSPLDMVTYYLWRFHDVSYRNHEIWLFWLLLCLNRDYVLTISIIIIYYCHYYCLMIFRSCFDDVFMMYSNFLDLPSINLWWIIGFSFIFLSFLGEYYINPFFQWEKVTTMTTTSLRTSMARGQTSKSSCSTTPDMVNR